MARKKARRGVVAFGGTAQALFMEQCALKEKTEGRLIPLPGEISAECGLAWSAPAEAEEEVKKTIKQHQIQIEGIYFLFL